MIGTRRRDRGLTTSEYVGWCFVAFMIALAIGVASAKMESDAYNRLTGANTTWWDAIWLDLRVTDSPKAGN